MRHKHKPIHADDVGDFVGRASADIMILAAIACALGAVLVDIVP